MLGGTRFLLSALVVTNHFWTPADNMLGFHAVAAFYMTSGFLMMRVLREIYGTDWRGIGRFLLNRGLRILPAYWFFLLLSLLLVACIPGGFKFGNLLAMPVTPHDWLANLAFFDLAWSSIVVIPPAWSLGIELLFYGLMALALAHTNFRVEAWFTVSLAVTIALLVDGADFGYRYYPAYAASMFFSLGALIYTHRALLTRLVLPKPLLYVALGLFCAFPFLTEALDASHLTWGFYGSALLYGIILVTVAREDHRNQKPVDRWLGDLSYPMYLSHFIAGGLVGLATEAMLFRGSLPFLALTFAATLAISFAYIVAVDRPLQKLRAGIRPTGGPATATVRVSPAQSPALIGVNSN